MNRPRDKKTGRFVRYLPEKDSAEMECTSIRIMDALGRFRNVKIKAENLPMYTQETGFWTKNALGAPAVFNKPIKTQFYGESSKRHWVQFRKRTILEDLDRPSIIRSLQRKAQMQRGGVQNVRIEINWTYYDQFGEPHSGTAVSETKTPPEGERGSYVESAFTQAYERIQSLKPTSPGEYKVTSISMVMTPPSLESDFIERLVPSFPA